MGGQASRKLASLALASTCGLSAVLLAWPEAKDEASVPPPTVAQAVGYNLSGDAADGGRLLFVTYYSSRCFTAYNVRATEFGDVVDVAVTVTYLPNPEQLSCPTMVVEKTQEVLLLRPIAGRRVTTLGEPLPLRPAR